jgi:hypothetical protein
MDIKANHEKEINRLRAENGQMRVELEHNATVLRTIGDNLELRGLILHGDGFIEGKDDPASPEPVDRDPDYVPTA